MYDITSDSVRCSTCVSAVSKGLLRRADFKEHAFLDGFRNWKKFVQKIQSHMKSQSHRLSVEKITLAASPPIASVTENAIKKEQAKNRKTFIEVICELRGVARCGVAVRGHEEKDGNLRRLLEERSATSAEMRSWLNRQTNFLSHEIQNELLEIMARMLQEDLVSDVRSAPFFSLIADTTTDVSATEQLSVCFRYVDDAMKPKEVFMGLYACPDTSASSLFALVDDAMLRLLHGTDALRGHCFDGASNMSGRVSGVQARIANKQPKSMFVHCSNHALDLALVEEAKEVELVADVMNIVRIVSNGLNTAKRKNMFAEHVLDDGGEDVCVGGARRPKKLLALCPTRWTVRCAAFRRFVENFDAVVATVTELTEDRSVPADTRCMLRGCLEKLRRFNIFFALFMCIQLFSPCELFAKQLQRPSLTSGEVLQGADTLIRTMQGMRSEEAFTALYNEAQDKAAAASSTVNPPTAPRITRPPKRLEQCASPAADTAFTGRSSLRRQYYEAVDLLEAELRRRFDQPGLKRLQKLESLILEEGTNTPEEMREALGVYGSAESLPGQSRPTASDIKPELLSAQLTVLRSARIITPDVKTVADLAEVIASKGDAVKGMLSEVVRLCRLIMTVPVSAASAERTFSALRRVKTDLRSTMSQPRLSHLMLLHIHQARAFELKPDEILRDFINRHPEKRVSVFGSQ